MDYRLIAKKGEYALIQRGSRMQEYAVVNGLDQDKGEWNYTCSYYGFGKYSKLSEEEALFKALDDFRSRTDRDYVSHERLLEISTLLKDGLLEDDADEAYEYMHSTVELSENEAKVLRLDMDKYRRKIERMEVGTGWIRNSFTRHQKNCLKRFLKIRTGGR